MATPNPLTGHDAPSSKMPTATARPAAASAIAPQQARAVVVTLPGEVDVANAGQVHNMFTHALSGRAAVLIADATQTTFCDCAGVGMLIRAHHEAAATGVQLRVAASLPVRRILALTKADQLLETYSTLSTAANGEPYHDDSNGDSDHNNQKPAPAHGDNAVRPLLMRRPRRRRG